MNGRERREERKIEEEIKEEVRGRRDESREAGKFLGYNKKQTIMGSRAMYWVEVTTKNHK